jgi:hypothetical protein
MQPKVNACLITFFMSNIEPRTVELNKKVVEKFNRSRYPHYLVQTQMSHPASIDLAWCMHGCPMRGFEPGKVPRQWHHDVVMFLDVDCLPLNDAAIDWYVARAHAGTLIGNVQRSNHIQNDEHLFAAPSALACSVETFGRLGNPSALPTGRGDVAEEYSYAAETNGVPLELVMPLSFDEPPAESASWALRQGMPVYGRGTTFGYDGRPMFWHQFQSFHPGQQPKFWRKAQGLLEARL